MQEETITIPKKEYEKLKSKSQIDDELLLKLVRGVEDIRAGRVKSWKKSTTQPQQAVGYDNRWVVGPSLGNHIAPEVRGKNPVKKSTA